MEPFKAKGNRKTGPEAAIQEKIIEKLRAGDWLVIVTHGNEFQSGLPDLYCVHFSYGQRWIEVKNLAGSYHFTPAQLKTFPALQSKGVGVWVLGSSEPGDLQRLFGPPNWFMYLLK